MKIFQPLKAAVQIKIKVITILIAFRISLLLLLSDFKVYHKPKAIANLIPKTKVKTEKIVFDSLGLFFLYFQSVLNEELIIPKNKAVERPNLLHVLFLACLVVVKKLHKCIGVEEFL